MNLAAAKPIPARMKGLNRATATQGSWLYCSKNIQLSVCARCQASPAKNFRSEPGVPSASQHSIALDSARVRPSSSASSGTLPFGLRARNSGVRVAPRLLSVSIQWYGRPNCSSSSFTLWQLPEGE